MSALRSFSWASSKNDYISGYDRAYDYLIVHLETLVRCICVACVCLLPFFFFCLLPIVSS